MVRLLIFAAALAQSGNATLTTDGCPELVTGKPFSAITSTKKTACVTVNVAAGEALQVSAGYPGDLALRATSGDRQFLADGFEFGQETLTLNAAGQYRVEIVLIGKASDDAPVTVPMSRNALPLQAAEAWQAAESSATKSKLSGKLEDISASLEHWQTIAEPSSVARTWLKLGDQAYSSGDQTRALDAYERALEICRPLADLRCAAEAANNSGLAARLLGKFNESFTRLEEAAQGWEKLGFPDKQARTLSNLGVLYSRIGDFQQSISAYDRARAILKDRDPLVHARILSNLGLIYLSLAQYDQSAIYFQQAISAEVKLKGAEADLLRTRVNFARTLMLQGQLTSARAVLERALAEAEKRPDRNTRAFALNNLGQTLWRLGLMDDAESRLQDALDLHRALGDKRGEAIALHYLGLIRRRRGDLAAARRLLNQSLQIRRDYGMRDDAADSLFELAALEFAAGDSARSRSLAEEAMPLLEMVRSHVPGPALRASFYARRRNLLDLLVAIAMRPDNKNAVTDGLLAAELGRGRSLLDLLAERHWSSPRPPELLERQAKIRREMDWLSQQANNDPHEYENLKRRMQPLIAEDEEVEARMRAAMENREPGALPLTSVSSLQHDVLSPQSAILEYQLGENVSHLWLVRDRRIAAFALPPRAAIERQVSVAVGLFRKVIERRRDPAKQAAYETAMRRLSSTLLGHLKAAELPSLLILVLDGDLNRVPFAALRLPTGHYLGIRHDLLRAPSSAFLLQAGRPAPAAAFPKSVLALYDPVFSLDDPRAPAAPRQPAAQASESLARLPFGEELKTISRLVPKPRRDFLYGLVATAETLQKQSLGQYGIVHFSTHAMINDEVPELSRIALSVIGPQGRPVSGFVLPYQLASLRLRGSLVVLSACDTALGKKVLGEGLIGFTSSLFSAGASQLILTLSEVDAQASSFFLSETYRHLLARKPVSVEHSLTLAREAFLKSERWPDPYYWASFVAVGMPALPNQREGIGPK